MIIYLLLKNKKGNILFFNIGTSKLKKKMGSALECEAPVTCHDRGEIDCSNAFQTARQGKQNRSLCCELIGTIFD